MKKFFFILSILFLYSNNVDANRYDSNQKSRIENYIGLRLGILISDTNVSRRISSFNLVKSPEDIALKNTNLIGVFFFGSRYFIKGPFFIGGEIDIDLGKTHSEKTVTFLPNGPLRAFPNLSMSGKTIISQQYTFSPSLIFGVEFSKKVKSFIGLGITSTKFKIKNKNLYRSSENNQELNKRKNALRLLIGVEYLISDNFSLRLNFSHENFQKIKISVPFSNAGSIDHVCLKPSFSKLTLGFLFKL